MLECTAYAVGLQHDQKIRYCAILGTDHLWPLIQKLKLHLHFERVATRLSRPPKALPVMKKTLSVKDIFAFTFDDFTLEGYEADDFLAAPIAV